MHKITFECEAITPIFLAGAIPGKVDLRPPSLKGLLRFWWRAMNGYRDRDELKRDEAEIFGGSGEDVGRSKVLIRIAPVDDVSKFTGRDIQKDCGIQWNFDPKQRVLIGSHRGIGYLLYSTALNKSEFLKARDGAQNGFRFRVVFSAQKDSYLRHALAAFWALAYLGGIGTRNRRGGGNIAITGIDDPMDILKSTQLNFEMTAQNRQELALGLQTNLQRAKSIVNNGKMDHFIHEYSNLSFSRAIISPEPFDTWVKALNDVGILFFNFRSQNSHHILESAVFGLPVRHGSKSVKGKWKGEGLDRRSSPLIFKIIHTNDHYYWLSLRLSGQFLPDNGVLQFNQNTQKPDYRLIDEFWNQLRTSNHEFILIKPASLQNLVDEVKEKLSPAELILFGPRARGDFHQTSAIDIAVETEEPIEAHEFNGEVNIVNLKRADTSLLEVIQREGVSLL
ncbi:MAG: type III-B CRISPR module RAMP protein Cmr1 [Candidatus Brocadia sp. WS118]|nr:MAG: type III-B CRISPR module RAMP protein Cmr1 [Candidatus Brocadia sp. WS118]